MVGSKSAGKPSQSPTGNSLSSLPCPERLDGSFNSRCCVFDNNSEGWGRGSGGRKVSFDTDCKIPPDFKKLNCLGEGRGIIAFLDLGRLVLHLKVTPRGQPSIFIEEEKEGWLHSLDNSAGQPVPLRLQREGV